MFTVITDTAANLSERWLAAHQVHTVSFSYNVEGADQAPAHLDDFDAHAYYEAIRGGMHVKTSQVTPSQYMDVMKPLMDAGQDILFVGLSSGVSGSFVSAQMAVKLIDHPRQKARLVDTLGAGLGEGLMVMRAVQLRDEGLSLDEAADQLDALCQSLCQVFTVEDLMHLKRTGRLSSVKALVGTVLKLKPLLKGDETGHIVNFANVRGRKQSIQAMARYYEELADKPEEQVVGISHADCPEDAKLLERLIRANRPPKDVLTVAHEPMTGSHIGPGALALFFFGGENARTLLV